MSAKNLALSGVGTFAMAAALCSSNIENLFTTDLLLTEHLNYTMLFNTDVEVHVMELGDDYIPVTSLRLRLILKSKDSLF